MAPSILRQYFAKIGDISEDEWAQLKATASPKEFKRGERLLDEGVVCRSFFFVEKGYLRTYYNKDGVEINLQFTFEGELTTNFKSLKSEKPSHFIIEAGEKSRVWIFDREKMKPLYDAYPAVGQILRRVAMQLLLSSEEYSILYKISTPAQRYQYIEQHRPHLLQRLSLSQLASYLGVTRETLSRIRSASTKVNL
jgi:CRP-like cAMP-binding protein